MSYRWSQGAWGLDSPGWLHQHALQLGKVGVGEVQACQPGRLEQQKVPRPDRDWNWVSNWCVGRELSSRMPWQEWAPNDLIGPQANHSPFRLRRCEAGWVGVAARVGRVNGNQAQDELRGESVCGCYEKKWV